MWRALLAIATRCRGAAWWAGGRVIGRARARGAHAMRFRSTIHRPIHAASSVGAGRSRRVPITTVRCPTVAGCPAAGHRPAQARCSAVLVVPPLLIVPPKPVAPPGPVVPPLAVVPPLPPAPPLNAPPPPLPELPAEPPPVLKIPPLAVPPDEIAASTAASDKDALVLLLQPLPARNNAEPTIASNQEARPRVITQVSTTTRARATRNDSRASGICDLAHTVDSRKQRHFAFTESH